MKTKDYEIPVLHRTIKIWNKDHQPLRRAAFLADMTIVELVHAMVTRELARQEKRSPLAIKKEPMEKKQ